MSEILFRELCISVAKSYDKDFQCDLSIKTYHLSKLRMHYYLDPNRFNGLTDEKLNQERVKFLTEVQGIVDAKRGFSD